MALRTRMRLQDVYALKWGGCKAVFAVDTNHDVAPTEAFTDATPWGTLEIAVAGNAARQQLVIGALYDVALIAVADPKAPNAAGLGVPAVA